MNMLSSMISVLISFLMVLAAMAFYTLMERKFLGYCQERKGPNKPSFIGILVPIADAIKLFTKQLILPSNSNQIPFLITPGVGLLLALFLWTLYPFSFQPFFLKWGLILFLCISSLNVYITFMAGWASNSQYSLLGALRGVAQTISYEISMALILITAFTLGHTLDLTKSMALANHKPLLMLLPVCLLWFISSLAETNRTPFDLSEGESELVSGFNVEYGSGLFALIFMAEYTNILMMSMITVVTFVPGHSTIPMIAMIVMVSSIFIWARASYPRMRYDKLMNLTWKKFLPFIMGACMLTLLIT